MYTLIQFFFKKCLFLSIMIFFVYLKQIASDSFTETRYENTNKTETDNLISSKRKWITELFEEAKTKFRIDSKTNIKCREDFEFYEKHLHNQSLWAIRMMESTEWPTNGIFSGRVYHLGNYDECLKASVDNFKGQYCLSQVTYDYHASSSIYEKKLTREPDENASAWDALKMLARDPMRLNRNKLNFALCIPSSCEVSDLRISLNNTLFPIFHQQGKNISVTVDPTLCTTKSNKTYSQEYYITLCMFVCLILLIAACTYKDMTSNKDELTVCTSFSIVKNVKKLTNLDTPNEILVIHSIKSLLMMLMIIGHRLPYFLAYPLENAEAAEEAHYMPPFVVLHLSFVDVFFMISGFMTLHSGFISMKKRGGVLIIINLVLRWIRMIFPFCVLMLYLVYILRYTGDGPLWNYKIGDEVSKCENSWWAIFLGINNIIKVEEQCLFVSWYISIDLQLAIIGEIVLYIFTKSEKRGAALSCLAMIGSTLFVLVTVLQNKYPGIMRIYLNDLVDVRKDIFWKFYVATYPRIAPYMIGFLAVFVMKILKEKQIKFSKIKIMVISLTSISIGEGFNIYGQVFYDSTREYDVFADAIYAALYHLVYAIIVAGLLCIYLTSGSGIFLKFFEWKYFFFFGRLTYSVFLLNTVIQLYHASSQKHFMPTASTMNLIWLSIGDVVWSYSIAFVFHLVVEAPIMNLCKILRTNLLSVLGRKKLETVEKTNGEQSKQLTN